MINNIIISRTDKIGDLVLSIPSLFMAKQMFPKAKLTVLVRSYNSGIIKNLPYVDNIINIDEYSKNELEKIVSSVQSDVFVALFNDKLISKLAIVSGAKLRIGPYSKWYSFLAFNKGIRQRRSESIKNEAEYNLDLIKKIDPTLYKDNFAINTSIFLTNEVREEAKAYYEKEKIGDKVLIVNPLSGGSAKNLTVDQYRSIIQKIIHKIVDLDIIVTAHANDRNTLMEMKQNLINEKVHFYFNGGDILNLAGIIERGNLFLGGSTGPTHIAGAIGKKIVAIYPNKVTQSPRRWGVYGNNQVEYFIPDKDNVIENYKNNFFDTYDEQKEELLLNLIERSI